MSDRYALFATVSLHDVQVDEVSVRGGQPLELGSHGTLHLPVPAGAPFVARARWLSGDAVEVTDGAGGVHHLGPSDDLEIRLGAVRVDLRLSRQFALRRTYPVAWYGSTAWLLTVMAFTVLLSQIDVVARNRCIWFGIDCPSQVSAPGVSAEYIARLLKEDYSGDRDGGDTPPPPKRPGTYVQPGWLPAGDPEGPKIELGGAEEVAPKPVRTPTKAPEPKVPAPRKRDESAQVASVPQGTPIDPAIDAAPDTTDGVADVEVGADPDADVAVDPTPPPAEEEEGFGMQDWMDTTPPEEEVALMIRYARHRLRIDPNDPDALSLLAYYQYLSEDIDGAEVTYDKLIAVDPEDAAAYNNKALIYKRRAEYAKEEGLYRVALALEPDDTTAMNNLAVNLAHQGRFDEALAYMERLEVLLPDDPYSDLHRAKIHAQMGEDDTALHYLTLALEGMRKLDTLHHIEFRQDIRVDPSFSRLRKDPRFRATLERFYGADAPTGG
ncbi:MAG: tetratricopeptide repeat protein [Alphaproteobacteria bacterium]|nr:tetratricopeptide repeat protein [Alphaproteobacteria bacterium]